MKLFILFISSLICYTNSAPAENKCAELRKTNYSAKNITDRQFPDKIRTSVIRKAALGRIADLGDVYDARTDQLIGISLYAKNIPAETVEKIDTPYSNITYVKTETIKEKIDSLGINAELAVNIFCGMINIGGSGNYLKDVKKSTTSVKTSLVYSIKTLEEHLRIFSNVSTCLINTKLLQKVDATHVVVGMEWGATVVLSLEQTVSHSSNKKHAAGALEEAVTIAGSAISDAFSAFEDTFETNKNGPIEITINGDIVPDKIPRTLNQSVEFIKQIPKLIERSNGGRGRIIKYILMPLHIVQKIMLNDKQTRLLVQEISKELVDQFMGIFQELEDTQLLINDVYRDMTKWIFMVPDDHFKNISTLKSDFENCFNDFKENYKSLVVSFRSGTAESSKLQNLIRNYNDSVCTQLKTDELLKPYTRTLRKIRLLDLFEAYHALFIDRRTDQYQILSDNYQKQVGIISADLNMSVSSHFVRGIVKLFQLEGTKNPSETIPYYIHDNPNIKIPIVTVYLEGNIKTSYPIDEREYIILISKNGDAIIMDAESHNFVKTFTLKELAGNTFAIIGDLFYKIDTKAGHIEAIKTEFFLKKGSDDIKWNQVGWFPKESSEVHGVAAVNNSHFYFPSANGILYKYDTKLKAVTNCTQGIPSGNDFSALVVNEILYLIRNDSFFSLNGTLLEPLTWHDTRVSPGLFELQGLVCSVGGQRICNQTHVCSTECFSPNHTGLTHTFKVESNIIRRYPAVIKTKLGVIIFGGMSIDAKGNDGKDLDSAEIYSHSDNVWRYIPTPDAMKAGVYSALSFIF